MSKKLDDTIEKALKNIEDDRKITKELLDDAIKYVAVDEARHREVGIIMSKYVETLQRSNEQLVKIAGMLSKNEKTAGLSDLDKEVANLNTHEALFRTLLKIALDNIDDPKVSETYAEEVYKQQVASLAQKPGM